MKNLMKVVAALAFTSFLGACGGGTAVPMDINMGGGSSGGRGVKEVAVDKTGMPIINDNEEVTHGGTSDGGTPINDIGGTGPYVPAPVTQTEQNQPVVIHDNPSPPPAPEPEPTNTDFDAVSS